MRTITLTHEQVEQLTKDLKNEIWHTAECGEFDESYKTYHYDCEINDCSFEFAYSIQPHYEYSAGTYYAPEDWSLDGVYVDDVYVDDYGYDDDNNEVEITNFDEVRSRILRWARK